MVGTGKITCAAAALLLLGAGNALAGGFSIYEAGARATAMGGAFTATADDGSAIFYNPAGIAFIPGTVLDLNLMPVMPSTDFTGYPPGEDAPAGETVSQSFPIPGLYFTHNPGRHLAFGVGVYAPFGVWWSYPTTFLSGAAAAGAIGLINSCGNVGGFVGPYLIGFLKDATGSFTGGWLYLAFSLTCAGLLILTFKKQVPTDNVE